MSATGNSQRFLNAFRLYAKAGRGGNGFPKHGGIGGKGGDVYFKGVKGHSLSSVRSSVKKHKKADDGEPSRQFRLFGSGGKDLIIPAPLGTVIKTDAGQILGDIINEDDEILVARGGAGGNPNNQFAGQKGESHHMQLSLKLIADVGLVGFPNAGKSTLLRALSCARPKVANYPFTTLHPMVGIMQYDDLRQISVADMPGLIEGAWCNMGMGHKFLQHIERTKLLLFVVDIEGFQLGPHFPLRSPLENVILLNKELELYKPELVEKPSMLLVNKIDVPSGPQKFHQLQEQMCNIEGVAETLPEEMRPKRFIKFTEVFSCSAKFDRQSVRSAREKIRELIDLFSNSSDEIEMVKLSSLLKEQLYDKNIKLH